MNRGLAIPPITNEDKIPHHQAVWRDYANDGQCAWFPPPATGVQKVSIEYQDGMTIIAWAHQADWFGAKRWRFGWPPA